MTVKITVKIQHNSDDLVSYRSTGSVIIKPKMYSIGRDCKERLWHTISADHNGRVHLIIAEVD